MADASMSQSGSSGTSGSDDLRTGPIPARTAHHLVLDIEKLGIDSSLVHISTEPALGAEDVGRVDQRTVTRPARRVVLGAAAGALIGVGAGLLASAIWSLEMGAVLVVGALIGVALGGLWSLYASLGTSVEATDLDTGQWAVVHVDVDQMDLASARTVRQLVRDADASARRTPARSTTTRGTTTRNRIR